MSRRDADPYEDTARPDSVFDAAGTTCAALRKIDWTLTTLGPPSGWPADLLRAAHTVVRAGAPMLLWWGEQFVQFHNDAVVASLAGADTVGGCDGCGGTDPLVARPASECWGERWHVLEPHARHVLGTGEPGIVEDLVLPGDGRPDVVWTLALAPLSDTAGRITGVLVNAVDLSARVTAGEAERRSAEAMIANLQVALESNRRIGIAIGVLMAQRRITDAAAFDLLREASQRRHRKLRDLAEDVLLTGALPD